MMRRLAIELERATPLFPASCQIQSARFPVVISICGGGNGSGGGSDIGSAGSGSASDTAVTVAVTVAVVMAAHRVAIPVVRVTHADLARAVAV